MKFIVSFYDKLTKKNYATFKVFYRLKDSLKYAERFNLELTHVSIGVDSFPNSSNGIVLNPI